jgi:Flp pilus assembly protein CpaB
MVAGHATPPAGKTRQVVVASRGLPAGALLQAGDVHPVRWPSEITPASALLDPDRALGRPLVGPIAAGEPVTSMRLLDTALTASLRPGQIAATIRLPDRRQAAILQVGCVIDVYAPPAETVLVQGSPIDTGARQDDRLVARGVRVLAVLDSSDKASQDGVSIVIATDNVTASHLASHPSAPFLATLRPPS